MGRDTTYDGFKKQKSASLRKVRHFFQYLVAVSMIRFAGLWPSRVNQKIGTLIGLLGYQLAKKDRGIANYQIDFCFPELAAAQRKQIIVDSFKNIGKTLMETLVIQKFRKNREKWIQLINPKVVTDNLAEGNGLIMVFGHLGNWELMGVVCEMLGVHGSIVSATVGAEKLDNILLENRRSDNISVIQQGNKMAPVLINKCFRSNNCLLLAFDQDIRVDSVFVDFFGRKASTSRNIAYLAQKYGSPVVSAFGTRLDDGTHEYRFDLLSNGPYQKGEAEIIQMTQSFSDHLEQHIRKHPSQWVWLHRRWKTQPDKQLTNQ